MIYIYQDFDMQITAGDINARIGHKQDYTSDK